MGQKTSPTGFRTGIRLPWQSTWYAPKADYGTFLVEDQKLRRYIDKKYNRQMPKGAVAKVEIVRTSNEVKVTLHSARPGVVIGPRGGEVDKLREELEALTGRKVNVNVIEIKEPDLNAALVGEAIAEQLGKRASFRRTMKQFCENAVNAGAKGVKISCSGRLAGAEIARSETQKLGSIPLHTLDADVDYAQATAHTTYGAIGIKVWIYKGKYGEVIESRQVRRRRPPRHEEQGRSEGSSKRRTRSAPKREAQAKPAVKEQSSDSASPAENKE
ncbi:MAG: 30S ribosomal protein S3 [Phycisphaerae bacterium]